MQLRFVDLFAGLGGFHTGLARLGHRCVMACEIDERLTSLYFKNFNIQPRGDIRAVALDDVPEHDLLCAGFPCQPFSKAGEQLGLACERDGDLFGRIVRILKHRQPQLLMLENVANLQRHGEGLTYVVMAAQLRRLGYDIDERVLSPHSFGIPQVRDRLFIVGSRSGLDNFAWPEPTGTKPSIDDVLDRNPAEARGISAQYARCIAAWQTFVDQFPKDEQLPSFPIWSMEFGATYPYLQRTPSQLPRSELARYCGAHGEPLGALPPEKRLASLPSYAQEAHFPGWKQQFIRQNRELYRRHREWIDAWLPSIREFPASLQKLEWNCKGEVRDLNEHILQFRASGVRVKRSSAAPALIAMTTTQVPIIAREKRYMTVRECSRLQGLGDLAYLPEAPTRAYRALGNAVNADLVTLVARQLIAGVQDQHAMDRHAPGARKVAVATRRCSMSHS